MRQRALQAVLLIHAIEQADLAGDALPLGDRIDATREAVDGRPLPQANAGAELNGDSERLLARRANALLTRLRVRSPGVDRILAAAAGPTGLDRLLLLLGFALGVAIAFADGGRIDIFAYPLIGLVIWNLVVYLVLIIRMFRSAEQARRTAGSATARELATVRRDGFLRRWLAGLYANRVRARIDALITHSIGFNAPLAPGLRRFGAEWWELGRPLFWERSRRILHLAAILAAVGLMAGYGLRGLIFRQVAGWGTTVFGPASAHSALVTLYGAASAFSGIGIPSAHDVQALAWTGPASGGGSAGPWVYLIGCTALIYIVLPRLIAVIVTTLSLWRQSATLRTPPTFPGYLASVLRPLSSPPEPPPPAESSG
ncbi:MAG TPA: DUF2868 domain-containing protein [Steroidobacteraceae bacterium]|nr:DUF2868 domain-containing protein [Steroidobacteraceae bacterium]